ncbi:MAG TPA: hypothetical protein VMV48_14960 [Gallionellaceae bacterium]|nr:hypothetical protein [Gallionellaceae bacterium]
MIVLETGFGDKDEAFIETRFKSGVNILFSDDNNKGKTLVMQGLMYSLGNEPIFPSGFNYRECSFYTKCDFDGTVWSFLRKYHSIIASSDGRIHVFDSISEFKHFFNSNIKKLPLIIKDGNKKIADLELLYQIFFLPQDKRDPSSIISSGYYKKSDFYELIYSITDGGPAPLDDVLIEEIKRELFSLGEEKRVLQKRFGFAKKHPTLSQLTNQSSDREAAQAKKSIIGSINTRISESVRDRTREENRISKLERLISELNSLNRDLSSGKVQCADCGSSRVIYKNEEFSFEVSNQFVRNEIIESIREQIKIKQEIIDEKTRLINHEQGSLQRELQSIPKSVQTIMLHAEEISTSAEIDNQISKVDMRVSELKEQLEDSKNATAEAKAGKRAIVNEIVDIMNFTYKELDPDGRQVFDDLFSKKGQTYSGSEEQEFYFSKIVALNSVLQHDYPIIIDSFRSGELSSGKEEIMIKLFAKINKQIIVTSTLKSEEYSANRYSNLKQVNAIDYSTHQNSHILSDSFKSKFNKIVSDFKIV